MEKLKKAQIEKIENWIYKNARPLEAAKWNLLWGKGSTDDLLNEMLKYQNSDGGFGNGFESDILIPQSSAIASAEAIFTAFDFGLDMKANWFENLLNYFMKTKQDTPSYWEALPRQIEDYPRPPWWNYTPDTKFTPNPCAVIAAAMLLSYDIEKKAFGNEIAKKCISLLISDEVMWDHDIYCVQKLFIILEKVGSELMDKETRTAMNRRILSRVSYNPDEWMNYVAQPFDFVASPESPWYSLLKDSMPVNVRFLLDNINDEGIWPPNFSWGVDTIEAKTATRNWKGYLAVKRVKLLKAFGLVEVY
jgi:hypothetical protein